MTDKSNSNHREHMNIIDGFDELRDRLHFLTLATSGMLQDESVPSDRAMCGILIAFKDCEKVIDEIELAVGA